MCYGLSICSLSLIIVLPLSAAETTYQSLSYEERILQSTGVAKKLLALMVRKQTNLALAADVTESAALIALAHSVGDYICALKIHCDIIRDFSKETATQLQAIAQQKQFLIIEDRKFADIDSIAVQQYIGGPFRIADWADLVTVHAVPGRGTLAAMRNAVDPQKRGILLITQMSSAGALTDKAYQQKAVAFAAAYPDFVTGFITRSVETDNGAFLRCTPGISLKTSATGAQQYLTPEEAFCRCGTDLAIVGRGIYEDPAHIVGNAILYKEACWQAYLKRMQCN